MDGKFYKFGKVVVSFIFKILYRPRVVGLEYISEEGSLVLAGNHTKWLDPLLLISCSKRQIHFLGKDSLFKGILKPIMRLMGVIPVNRSIHDKDALYNAESYLKEGCVIGIFREGTINRGDGVILPFKIGAVKMSKDTNSSIIPFVITGKYKIFRRGIKIEFLKTYKVSENLDLENKKLMDIVSRKLEEGYNECD